MQNTSFEFKLNGAASQVFPDLESAIEEAKTFAVKYPGTIYQVFEVTKKPVANVKTQAPVVVELL